jgi:hypothetical protein
MSGDGIRPDGANREPDQADDHHVLVGCHRTALLFRWRLGNHTCPGVFVLTIATRRPGGQAGILREAFSDRFLLIHPRGIFAPPAHLGAQAGFLPGRAAMRPGSAR